MIDKNVFTREYITETRNKYKIDPQILERSIFALGLVEALAKTGAEFIFKGGSSLMLLLEKPMRLSTDVDIIVKPDTDIMNYINKASEIYPFVRYEEDIRLKSNNIIKRHFVFFYKSIWKENKETPILLDVLFEENHYSNIIQKELKTEFIKTSGDVIVINLPSVESLLGDKLTAFAPKTIGVIPISERKDGKLIDKKVETIKQFFDVACLFDVSTNFNDIKSSYINTATTEIKYRNLNISYKECLIDTIHASLSIITKGKHHPDDYIYYLDGIRGLGNFLINIRFNAETAYKEAAKVLYLASCILTDNFPTYNFIDEDLLTGVYSKIINNIRKIDSKSFNMIVKSIKMINSYEIIK